MAQQAYDDVLHGISPSKINELEERRIDKLNEAGVNEDEVIDNATQNCNNWNSYSNENIVRGKADVDFAFRDQWNVVERSEFMRLSKPPLMFNVCYDALKKAVGENRKNRPDLTVRSINGQATQEELTLRANLLRTIAYQSQAELVYQTAFKSSTSLGFGAFQVDLEYEGPRSFNRVIVPKIIIDPTTCSWDPTALMPHKGDGNFCSRSYVFTQDQFFATYPYILDPVSWIDPFMLLDYQSQTRDLIVVNDYFVKEWYPITIKLLSNGMVVTDDQWEDMQNKFSRMKELAEESLVVNGIILNEIPKIEVERQSQDYRIMHYRMLRNQIIDFTEWHSRELPIVFVDGDSFYIEGRQYTKSLIHEAKDAQKTLNYFKSEITAEIKNRRREQWMATPDNIKGYEQQWRNPESQIGALMAQPDPKTGQMPIKSPAWEISQGLLANAQAAYMDVQQILGYTDQQDSVSGDSSGRARRERKMEGMNANYVFYDNFRQSIAQGGRVMNGLLKYVIGENERVMNITNKDGKSEKVVFNQKKGDKILNTLSHGEFDVEISAGPSSSVQKEISLELFKETVSIAPQLFPLIADLWAESLDLENMPTIRDRFKTLVPADILAKEEGKPIPPKKPDPQQEMLQAELQEKQANIKAKLDKSKIDEAKLQLEAKELQLEEMKLKFEAIELQEKLKADKFDHEVDLKKANLTHTGKLTDTLSKLHMHEQTLKVKPPKVSKE
jgi:Phage P22-like portal protein